MICVSIGRGRHQMMIAEYNALAEQGAELVELRLDYIRRTVNLETDPRGPALPGRDCRSPTARWRQVDAERRGPDGF